MGSTGRGGAGNDRVHRRAGGTPRAGPALPFQKDGGTDDRETIEGTLDRVVFSNEETGWSVVRISAVRGRQEAITAVGVLLGLQPGESLRLRGRWENDPRYGRQFHVASYLTIKPATLAGIEKYLGSGLIPGIGRAMAARLVRRFGLETLDVIERQPARLAEVEGIGPVRSERIRAAWAQQHAVKEVMVFLHTHAVSASHAARIYKQYGEKAAALVRENPYRLATDILGIGFKTADKIAASLGHPPTSPRRAEAAVLHHLSELSDEGHVHYPGERLIEETAALLQVERVHVETALQALAKEGRIVLEPATGAAISDLDVSLRALHTAETECAEILARLIATPAPPLRIDEEAAVGWFEARQSIELAARQREALRRALRSKVLVITGGPGTGKTTLVNGIIRILEKKDRRISLCAPTGRAARRLAETTRQPAKTIHRLLEFNPREAAFLRHASRPLESDVVIVDEASMIDTVLFMHLLRAVPPFAQLILVGDVDQLPSVGPGNVLRDLIRSGLVEVARLTEIFRQAAESLIVVNAHRVNRGEQPITPPAGSEGADFYFIQKNEPEEILATLKGLIADRIPSRFGLDPITGIQVISPMKKGLLGVANLNAELQILLNPAGGAAGGEAASRSFRMGDKVMQIRNNYNLDVFNGDIGRVVAVSDETREIRVRFEERVVGYEQADLDELVLAYACSVHKSQGSEYPAVVIPLHTQHYMMLQRNLLYTAITRGKRLVVIVGTRRALAVAVRNDRIRERHTRLAERLKLKMAAGA